MAEPAAAKNQLGIPPFWQKASAQSPTEWEIRNQQFFLRIIAKDGIKSQNLLGPQPQFRKPQEAGYELPITGETNVQGRDRELRNQEERLQCENQCQLLDNLGPTADGVPWEEAVSKLYLSVPGDGRPKMSKSILP